MKEKILGNVKDLISNFLYYDRRDDEDLPLGSIELAVENNEITVDEIVQCFRETLSKKLEINRTISKE